jgi:hypothetical protein
MPVPFHGCSALEHVEYAGLRCVCGDGGMKKKPSGAQYRKLRKKRERAARKKTERETGARESLLDTIGPLPLDDPETAMPWFRRAQIVLLGELLKDPEVPVRELFTAVKQMSEAAGKTNSPVAWEARLAAVEESLAGTRGKGAVEVKATNGLPRPPTARGGSRARRPRALEGNPSRLDGS